MRRIFSEAQALGLREPDIIEIGMRVRLTVYLAEPKTMEPLTTPDELPTYSRLDSRLESKLAAKVLVLLDEQDAGKAQLAGALGHKSVSGELHKQIRRLMELGLIEMTLPDKPNSRLQKYRLTEQGRQLNATLRLT